MPCVLVEEKQVEEIAEDDRRARLTVVDVRRGELLRRGAGLHGLACARTGERPASVSKLRFTSAKRTCSITCSLWLPPGTSSMLMTCVFGIDAVAISPMRSITFVLDTRPDKIVAPSLVPTVTSSPGKSACSCCSRFVIGWSTTMSYCRRVIRSPDDQADRARLLAVDEDLARLHNDCIGHVRDSSRRCGSRRTGVADDRRTPRRELDPRVMLVVVRLRRRIRSGGCGPSGAPAHRRPPTRASGTAPSRPAPRDVEDPVTSYIHLRTTSSERFAPRIASTV